jgi:hypothetical protein
MPGKSSDDMTGCQSVMLLLNLLPLLHAAASITCLFTPWPWLFPVVLYVVPVISGRILREKLRSCPSDIELGSPTFILWWACFQCQVLFLRFPVLEEILRMIPGLYSLWLRAWGSRIGTVTYWAPGTVILDRGFLEIGDRVVFGAGVRINPHVMEKTTKPMLRLSPITIGDDAVIGGYSLLTAGTEIASGEATRAFLISPPFSRWENGKRNRNQI